MKTKIVLTIVFASLLFSCSKQVQKPISANAGNNLVFYELADVWDEAMPLGNAIVGNLIWQKEGKLIIENPFKTTDFKTGQEYKVEGENLIFDMISGEKLIIEMPKREMLKLMLKNNSID